MIHLSVAVIAYNEEEHIGRCLRSVEGLADEILVVDSFSTDKTPDICRRAKARVITAKFAGYIEQKNLALDSCRYDHILSLDADEALSDTLRTSILAVKKNWKAPGYVLNRLNHYGGNPVRHCGWYPDRKLRLVYRPEVYWGGTNPHDILRFKNPSLRPTPLDGDILHYSYKGLDEHMVKTNRFTSIAAQEAHKRGKRAGILSLVLRPPLTFLRDYLWRRGFLDGSTGFVVCVVNAVATFLKYGKIAYPDQGSREGDPRP